MPTELDTLTEALRAAHPGVDLRGVHVTERARCGDGLASTADRLALRLELGDDPATRGALPERAIVKTILLNPALRFGMPVITATARVTRALARVPLVGRLAGPLVFASIGVYQRFFPHAPAAMYANEVRFYAELRPRLNIEAPRVYASHIDEQTGSFQIVLEDLRERGASFPNATTGRTLAQARSWIANLARLHAEFWASPRFADTLAWVPRTNRGGMFPVFDGIGFDLIRDQVRRSPDKRELLAPLGRSLESLWADTWRAQALFEADPPTLCHGDAHVGNSYVVGDAVGLLDWQLMVRGCWAHDLGYALATGLSSEDRRAHERELLAEYLDRLAELGVRSPPSFEHAWLRYRQSMIWGLVIGWLITPPQNYGVPITRANIAKMVQAMLDLDTLGALAGDESNAQASPDHAVHPRAAR